MAISLVNAAKEWLMSEPGDLLADDVFKMAFAQAGHVPNKSDVFGMVCTGLDDHTVQVIIQGKVISINTLTGVITSEVLPS